MGKIKLLKEMTLEEAIIKTENLKLRNPFLGGLGLVHPLFTDDHIKHIFAHLKCFYNLYALIHILEHIKFYFAKKRSGLEFLTNNFIVEYIEKAQKALNIKKNDDLPNGHGKNIRWN